MKKYWASGGTGPHILHLSTRWRWMVSFMTQLLYAQGKSPQYPLDRRLGGPRASLDTMVKRKIPNPHWELNPRMPTVQPIASFYTD
jgi:hypothetical protein